MPTSTSQCVSSQPNTNNATAIIHSYSGDLYHQHRCAHFQVSEQSHITTREREHAWGHNWHTALLQHIASKWPKCFMRNEVQTAKQWLLFSWPNIQIQGSFMQQRNTLMRGTLFWPWCMHATWVADGTCDWSQHYSLDATDHPPNRPYLMPREFHLEKHLADKQFATDSKYQLPLPG
jgi:hypothetical protein